MHFHVTPSELLIGMLVVLAATALLAEKIKVAYPILLVVAGLMMGMIPIFVPSMPRIRVDPDVIFLTFLPPLLYYAGLLTTWRDFKANIRPISELAIGLVLTTMAAVAAVAHFFIPDMPWAASFLLGAIVSPPDAVAATAVLEKLHVPKRLTTILEGESLVNDATALVAYRIALPLALVANSTFSLVGLTWSILWVPTAGIAIGLAAAWCCAKLLEKIEAPAVESTLALLIPFAAYIPAEKLHASGVLAAVAAGIYMGRRMPEVGSPKQRIRTFAVWENLVFLLNGVIFILIGLQLYDIVLAIGRTTLSELLWEAGLISATAIVVRVLYTFPAAYLPRLIPAVRRAEPQSPPWQNVAIISWAGMRGIVTLAAALALSDALPQKNVILFLSFGVILATLVFQGLTLPPLIKLLGVKQDHEQELKEEVQARLDAAHAAVSRLAVLGLEDQIDPEAIDRVRAEYDLRIISLGGNPFDPHDQTPARAAKAVQHVRHEALIAERKMITFMRDQNILGDEVLRRILVEIDLEEAKLIGK
jgi:CPA1 family monovalent cation:H+ antiporter